MFNTSSSGELMIYFLLFPIISIVQRLLFVNIQSCPIHSGFLPQCSFFHLEDLRVSPQAVTHYIFRICCIHCRSSASRRSGTVHQNTVYTDCLPVLDIPSHLSDSILSAFPQNSTRIYMPVRSECCPPACRPYRLLRIFSRSRKTQRLYRIRHIRP